MVPSDIETIVRRAFEAMGRGDEIEIDALFADDYTYHILQSGRVQRGADYLKHMVNLMKQVSPDFSYRVEAVRPTGPEQVQVRWTASGEILAAYRRPSSGAIRREVSGESTIRVIGGKIVEQLDLRGRRHLLGELGAELPGGPIVGNPPVGSVTGGGPDDD